MKNTTMACLILILAGCSVAPTTAVTVNDQASAPKTQVLAESKTEINTNVKADVKAEEQAEAKTETASMLPVIIPVEEKSEMVSAVDPVRKVKNQTKIDMKERIALANQMMKADSSSDAPVVCETKARRTPAGQLIYESSCH